MAWCDEQRNNCVILSTSAAGPNGLPRWYKKGIHAPIQIQQSLNGTELLSGLGTVVLGEVGGAPGSWGYGDGFLGV